MPYTVDFRVWIEIFLVSAAGFWACRKFLPALVALGCVAGRMGFTVWYFTRDFHGYWVGGDGLRYFYGGSTMLGQGYNPISALFTHSGLVELHTLATGSQITYFWWNFLVLYLFGARFCVPVICNTGLSFVAALYFYKILLRSGVSTPYARGASLLLLLHPEIVAYTSIANYKDVLVYCLTVAALYYLLVLTERITFSAVGASLLIAFVMFGLRFYVPLIELATFGIWVVLFGKATRRWWLFPLAVVAAVLGARYIQFANYLNLVSLSLAIQQIGYGYFHMLLTPRPYALPFWESFLFVPAVCNWLGIPLICIAWWPLWRDSKAARLLLLYAMVMLLTFSLYPEFQEYREQFQYYFIIIWAQYHGGWMILRWVTGKKARLGADGKAPSRPGELARQGYPAHAG